MIRMIKFLMPWSPLNDNQETPAARTTTKAEPQGNVEMKVGKAEHKTQLRVRQKGQQIQPLVAREARTLKQRNSGRKDPLLLKQAAKRGLLKTAHPRRRLLAAVMPEEDLEVLV